LCINNNKSDLRILHIIPSISDEAGGPSYSVLRLCESLIAQGDAVALATLDWSPMNSPPLFLRRFPLGLGPRRLGSSPAMLAWLAKSARAGEADLMHNHSLWMMPNVYPGWIAKKSGLPLVVSPRGTLSNWAFGSGSLVKRWFWPWLQHPALQPATCFHATSQAEYRDIRRMGFRQAVAIIPNGIDIPEWTPKATGPTRTLLFLGRIHPVKGLDGLLRAWAIVQSRFPHWQLRVVGPDNRGYLHTMRQLAATLKLERVVFQGALFGADKWRAYRDADLFVLPTHSENFGMSVAEALAAGTPAIVTHGAPWQGLEPHGAGWWIGSGVDPLVACLESALSCSPGEMEAMGRQGRAWMDAQFSWQRIGQQMAQTYRWLIQGGSLPDWVRLD
jgi:glycosyltransferase involved in cell wall biosynthesis